MKSLILTLSLLTAQLAAAQQTLPTIQLTEQALGGAVLMIEMKHALVVDRGVNERVLQELGEGEKKNLFRDFVMSKSVEYLRRTYDAPHREATNQLIGQYEKLLSTNESLHLK